MVIKTITKPLNFLTASPANFQQIVNVGFPVKRIEFTGTVSLVSGTPTFEIRSDMVDGDAVYTRGTSVSRTAPIVFEFEDPRIINGPFNFTIYDTAGDPLGASDLWIFLSMEFHSEKKKET